MVIILLGTLVTIFHPPAIYNTDPLSKSLTRYVNLSFPVLSRFMALSHF